MKLLYVLLFLILSGCSDNISSRSAEYCKDQGYLGVVIYGSNNIACSDGELTSDGMNYKTSNGTILVISTYGTRSGSFEYRNYFLKF